MKFSIVPLTNQEVAEGKLLAIGNAITNAFLESAKRITSTGRGNFSKEAIIHFDNSSTATNFIEKYGEDISNVLYINDDAMAVTEASGISLSPIGSIDDVPETAGLWSQMAY
jgi:predicted membrane-bound spermidine synthase